MSPRPPVSADFLRALRECSEAALKSLLRDMDIALYSEDGPQTPAPSDPQDVPGPARIRRRNRTGGGADR